MVICIVGPTGVGKTKLSVSLAKLFDGEVINADSTQVYKGLDIATAKVTEEEKENVVHHLFDIKDINDDYTVYDYQKDARAKIEEVLKKGKTPILVGGTGLYIKACLYDYKFNEEVEKQDFKDYSNEELYEKLLSIDPVTTIHKNNRQRIERALNYYNSTNQVLSDKEKTDTLLYDTLFIGLTTDRDILYDRINKRVNDMVNNGLLEEAKRVFDSNIRTKAVLTPIGYKELFPYFEGKQKLDECLDLIRQRSRRYAKRQYTWNNHQFKVHWFNTNYDDFKKTIEEVKKYIEGVIK